MLLTIDCGNTNTVFSIWDGKEFLATWRTSTEWQRTADQYFVWLTTLMNARKLDIEIDEVIGVGSGGLFAECAARALMQHTNLGAEEIARAAMQIAADKCIYTSHNWVL